ncbi:hypothetical protein PIB30_055271 [Stylosanthes scabra]|uniref:Uncharacterized protein n=1 Tax=Stylosanthes scabra TaxID=79078 RepID=A0ABU6TJP2_9FABA|nr:hypothetical protein [Stylosanthes scabra]
MGAFSSSRQGGEQDQLVMDIPPDLPIYDLPAPQLHQPEDGHLSAIRVCNRRGGRAGQGRGQVPVQEPVQELPQPVQEPVIADFQTHDAYLTAFRGPRRVDDALSSGSASHGNLRGGMRPYMSDTSEDAPADDQPQDKARTVRRPPACGTGGCLQAPPARRGRRSGRGGQQQ